MNIFTRNSGQATYCQQAEVTEIKCIHSSSARVRFKGNGFYWGSDGKRSAQLEFHSSDDIEVLIQNLKKVQAEMNLKLLEAKERAA